MTLFFGLKVMTKKKNKFLSPIDVEAYIKYRCYNKKCEMNHWVSLSEARTPNYKIVCDCGKVLRPKLISKLKLIHKKKKTKNNLSSILEESYKVLSAYGFSKQESDHYIRIAFDNLQSGDIGNLVKEAIRIFGENNAKHQTN